jgi:hypothetical protein
MAAWVGPRLSRPRRPRVDLRWNARRHVVLDIRGPAHAELVIRTGGDESTAGLTAAGTCSRRWT